MPNCLPSYALLFMAIFLYGRYINWRNIKESQSYIIKAIIAIVLAVILNQIYPYIRASNMLPELKDILEIIPLIFIGIIWHREYKKDKAKFPSKRKTEVLKVAFKDGYWICPSCNKKNKDKYNFCEDCGQEVIKS